MATVTVTSSNPSFSKTFFNTEDNQQGSGRPREASFSSYLSVVDETFSVRLSGDFSDHRSPNSVQVILGSGRKKGAGDDDELDVFGAEKYFNGSMDGEDEEKNFEKTLKAPSSLKEPVENISTGRRALSGTPSICSESSANSRSLLLRDSRRERSRNNAPRSHSVSRKFLGIFHCSCYDETSVEIDNNRKGSEEGEISASQRVGPEQASRQEPRCKDEMLWWKSAGIGASFTRKGDDYFFPPMLNPVRVGNSTVAQKLLQEDPKLARVSPINVFSGPFLVKEDLATSLRRSFTIMSPFPGSVGGGGKRTDDDVCSDASSDLFEIGSLSASTVPLGGTGDSSMACYEPSEASIEWSVVTASAVNFSHVTSDGETSPPKVRRHDRRLHQQRSGGLLMGCGSYKSVNVASATYKAQEFKMEPVSHQQRQRHKSTDALINLTPEIRYHSENSRPADIDGQAALVLAPRGIPRHATPNSTPCLQVPLHS